MSDNQAGRFRRRTALAVAVTIATVLAVVGVVAIIRSGGEEPGATGPATTTTTTGAPGATTGTPTGTPAPTTSTPGPASFGYQPLWPFANAHQVLVWQRSYRAGGHEPWHLDPAATALAFTSGYLGFDEIDTVVGTDVRGTEAHVTVGYVLPGGRRATAAVLHLARYGDGADAPWEVVGSGDTDLTLTTPRYGTTVRSPVTVGGLVTGVDENIVVRVLQPSATTPIGTAPGVPAGGQRTPWSTAVTFDGASGAALTVVAATGGHYQGVERFAITGVRPAR